MAENEVQDRWLWVIDEKLVAALFGEDTPAEVATVPDPKLAEAQAAAEAEQKRHQAEEAAKAKAAAEEAARAAEEAARAEHARALKAQAEEAARAEEVRIAAARAEEARIAAEEAARAKAAAEEAEAEARAEQAFIATLWDKAQSEFRSGNYEQALEGYRGVIENLLPDATSHYNAGVCLRKLRRPDEAKQEFLKALEVDPDLRVAKTALAWCHLELGKPELAVKVFEENLGEENHGVAEGYAQSLQQLARYDEAQTAYARLLEKNPADVPTLKNLVAIAAHKNDIGLLADSSGVLLEAEPGSSMALAGMVTVKLADEQYEAAFESAGDLLRTDTTSYAGWFNFGLAAQRTNRIQAADQAYRKAMQLDPGRPEAPTNLACIYFGQGDLDAAQALFQKQLGTDPAQPLVLWNLGLVFERRSHFAAAEDCFARLLRTEPGRPDALFHLGYSRFQLRNWAAAAASFEHCLESRRSWIEAMLYLGLANWNLGDLSTARHRFDDALTQDPLNIPALHCRTALALAMGDLTTGPELEAQLADLNHTLPEFCYNLGVLQEQANQPEAAMQSYHRAVALKPAFGHALLNLGNQLAAQGRKDEAVQAWLSALTVQPELSSLYSGLR
jgi:tetratricopeptide (TPR) repeat protein